MKWTDHVLVCARETPHRDDVLAALADLDVRTHVAETAETALQMHTTTAVDLMIVAPDRDTERLMEAVPGLTRESDLLCDSVDELADDIAMMDGLIADQCAATVIEPNGETHTTRYGDIIVDGEEVILGREADLPEWIIDDAADGDLEVVVSDRRGDIQTAFTVQGTGEAWGGLTTLSGTPEENAY